MSEGNSKRLPNGVTREVYHILKVQITGGADEERDRSVMMQNFPVNALCVMKQSSVEEEAA